MAETTLVSAATVAAAASCTVVAYLAADDDVDFRVECDQTHTVKFYAADATFSAITSAALMPDYTRTGVASTSATDGNLYTVDVGAKTYLACVVTNNGSSSATVTVAAE